MGAIRYQLIDDEVVPIHRVIVARFETFTGSSFRYDDVREWFQSDQGQFIIRHALEQPRIESIVSPIHYDTNYYIIADMKEKQLTEFYLRWGKYGNDQT